MNSYYHPDEFDGWDITCAALVLLPIIICGIIMGLGLVWLVHPVNADTLITNVVNDTNAQELDPGATWALARAGGTGGAYVYIDKTTTNSRFEYQGGTSSNTFDELDRGTLTFNFSALGSTATISSGKITVYAWAKEADVGEFNASLVDGLPVNPMSLVATDFVKTNNVRQANDILYADMPGDWSHSVMANWTLTNLTFINKTGLTVYYAMFSQDRDNLVPAWGSGAADQWLWRSMEYSSGTYAPFATIVYTTGIAPVASFTCTKNFVRIPNSVTCTDGSTNVPTSWSWNMGDGSAAITTQNVTYQYTKRGMWGITLNATNAQGSNVSASSNVRVAGYENNW
jgi:hypothetical protein